MVSRQQNLFLKFCLKDLKFFQYKQGIEWYVFHKNYDFLKSWMLTSSLIFISIFFATAIANSKYSFYLTQGSKAKALVIKAIR